MVGENCSITKLWGISKPDLKPTEADAKILVGFGRGQTWHARSRHTFLVHKTRAVGGRMRIPVHNKLRGDKLSLFPTCTALRMVEAAAQDHCPVHELGLELWKSLTRTSKTAGHTHK